MKKSRIFRIVILGLISLSTSFFVLAQEKDVPVVANLHDKLAVIYKQSVDLLESTYPAFQEAFKKQLAEGKQSEAVASWLKLLELTLTWPNCIQMTESEYNVKQAEMMQELLMKAEEAKGDSAQSKSASPKK